MSSAERCVCGAGNCFGYRGPLDTYVCPCDCHNVRTQAADGRSPCQAQDKRWADPGFATCRFHRAHEP